MKNRPLFISLLAVLTIVAGCKKDNQKPPVDSGPVEIWENVHVINSNTIQLDTVASDFNSGTYVFTASGTPPTINVSDVIVGSTGEGYIRIVNSVSVSGNTITLQTSQGRMEDVFKSGEFNFTGNLDDMTPGKNGSVATSGFSYSVNNHMLYNQGPLQMELLSGTINLDPEWYFDFGFNESGITKFELSTTGSTFSADAEVKATASQAVSLITGSDVLTTMVKHQVYLVGEVPVVLTYKLKWVADYSATVAAAVTSTANVTTTSPLEVGVKYSDQQWQGIYNITPATTVLVTQPAGNVSATINYAWRPELTVSIYGLEGPYANILAPTTEIKGTVASPSLDWDIKADAWLKTSLGANVTILGYTIASYGPQVWETDKLTYRKPDKIERVGGDNQQGPANAALPQPIKVKITDSEGYAQSGVPVYFNVTAGGGSINPTSILTDANGIAEATWILGPQQIGLQYAEASAKFGDGSFVNQAPIDFAAVVSETGIPSTVTDIDGNVYQTVVIGSQTWMTENLRTSHYASGDAIINVTDSIEWTGLTSGAWAHYNNDSQYEIPYGKLYNHYAVVDQRNVCPTGWHVPTDAEWTEMLTLLDPFTCGTCVGGSHSNAGAMMRTTGTTLWPWPNSSATNSSGFSAVPGGFRPGSDGSFWNLGTQGYWWSSSVAGSSAWSRCVRETNDVPRQNYQLDYGLSVRCVQD